MNAKRGYVPDDDNNFSDQAIKTLKKASSHVFYLINEGYDIKQVASILRIPQGTVKSRLKRGRSQLKTICREEVFEA